MTGTGERRRWRAVDDALLRSLAGRVPAAQVARTLGRSQAAVRKRASRIGVGLWAPPGGMRMCPRCGEWRRGVGTARAPSAGARTR